MPITAKLSRQFYERLGDDVANELVEWFNSVDLSYRQELRDLFATHFGQLEARLSQQTAELRAELDGRFAGADARVGELRGEVRVLESRLDARLAWTESKLVGWMFLFWAALMGTVIGLLKL